MARRKKMVEEVMDGFDAPPEKTGFDRHLEDRLANPEFAEEYEKAKNELQKEKPSHLIDGQKKLADHLGCSVDLEEVGETYQFVCHRPQKKVVFTKWMGLSVIVK
jgi:hypothetical protein